MLAHLRPDDVVVVWRLDRLGRSLKNLIALVEDLAVKEVGFRSLTEGIDTTNTGGKLVFHIFAALAEFERDLIKERTLAGLAAARARGRVGGRPPVMTADKVMGGAKDVRVQGAHRGGHRKDSWCQSENDLSAPGPCRIIHPGAAANFRQGTARCQDALPEHATTAYCPVDVWFATCLPSTVIVQLMDVPV